MKFLANALTDANDLNSIAATTDKKIYHEITKPALINANSVTFDYVNQRLNVRFNEPLKTRSSNKIVVKKGTIAVKTGAFTDITETVATETFTTGFKITFQLKTKPYTFNIGDTLTLEMAEGAVTDTGMNTSAVITRNIAVLDNERPTLVSGAQVGNTLVFTFSENISFNRRGITLMRYNHSRREWSTWADDPTVSGKKLIYNFPKNDVTRYALRVLSSGIRDTSPQRNASPKYNLLTPTDHIITTTVVP